MYKTRKRYGRKLSLTD